MSPSDPSDSGEPRRSTVDGAAGQPRAIPPARRPADDDEDALDLGDLDALGVDGVVAQLHDDPVSGEPVAPRRFRSGRSAVLSVFIVIAGAFVLAQFFPDFRYWLRSNDPEDIGHAADLANNGRMPQELANRYVTIRGTPDVQNVIRMSLPENYVSYVRLTEGGGSLFAAEPRSKDEPVRDKFNSTFTGRVQPWRRDRAYPFFEQYLRDQPITRTIDTTTAALMSALRESAAAIDTAEGRLALADEDKVRIVVRSPDARVQIGTSSVRKPEDAEARVAALGLPYRVAETGSKTFHSFVVRIPEAERAAALAKLQEGLEDPSGGTDPKRGAAVLPGSVTLSMRPGELGLAGDDLVLPANDQTSSLFDVDGGKLVPRAAKDGRVHVPVAWVETVRVERIIGLDPNGFVIRVDDSPQKHRLDGLVWLVVAALVGLNLANLGMHLRRRTAA